MITLVNRVIRKIKQKLDDRDKQQLLETLKGKVGIEIGGPSYVFSSGLPLYTVIKNLDGCNFSTNTVWEGTIAEGLIIIITRIKKVFNLYARRVI